MTKTKSRPELNDPKRLIQPLEVYILLPDRLCTFNVDSVRYTPCMTDLIIRTAESSQWLTDTELVPVNWLTLRLEPQKMISVVAAVIPMFSYRFKWPESGRNLFQFHSSKVNGNRSLIETLPGVQDWNFDSLVNLQVVVVVRWPDPCAEVFEKSDLRLPNAYTIRKALRKRKPITLGVPSYVRDTYCVDLSRICVPGKHIILQSDRFALSTAELALALLTALSRGVLKDCNAIYANWLHTLVKADQIIPSVHETGQKIPQSEAEILEKTDIKEVQDTIQSSNAGDFELSKPQVLESLNRSNKADLLSFVPPILGPPSGPLKYSRLGLIGLSSELPLRIAHLAQSAIGMEVAYYQKHPVRNLPYTHYENLKDLLRASDVIILADDSLNQNIPTNPKSQFYRYCAVKHRRRPHLWLTFEHFKCLPSHSLLISVTSIQCVDFSSLNLALRFGLLCGAGLTMPLVWFSNLTEFEALRQLPNTFILPPATSSVCAHSDLRIQIAQEVLEVITHILSKPNQMMIEHEENSTLIEFDDCRGDHMTSMVRVCPTRDLSTACSSDFSSFPRSRRLWPAATTGLGNASNRYNHNSTSASCTGSISETTTDLSRSWTWINDRLNRIWKRISQFI
ncbi:hypothetical protein FGIG_04259 [Fasciola gigantica]|uniref:D-isomer specific 2-hydroxyacid dehydrogenase NAD-binding domain-containing protein n=1 Tax=Fasciola gigantica TaxID=46835 RepID=A0A504YL78_FASGI|nr:hypothetical protein FGIG_04259 [Fasciola gigantica]